MVEQLVEELEHRGRSSGLKEFEDFSIGHVLHPVVGHVEQPVRGEGTLTANCEIYNWWEMADKHQIDVRNDAELLLELLDSKGLGALEGLDGVYALAYYSNEEVILARDLLGIKPIWYSRDPFAFASEKQALERAGLEPRELHPRQMLRYDTESGEISFEQREFFDLDVEDKDLDAAAEEIKELFLSAVEKRIPEGEVALLFSGGLDSTMVAAALQELGKDFTCYTAGIQHGNVNAPRDVEWAEEVARDMGLELESYEADLEDVEEMLPELAEWISSTSTVKLGVALPFHFALQHADQKVVFSGLGSEQLYAGYSRMKENYYNQECLSGLRGLFERDLYRDDVVSMRNGLELRVPFLDQELVEHALTIPGEHKVSQDYRKYVLRLVAEKLGVPEEVAWREKTAAQYGSNFDKAIARLGKDDEFESKQSYLNTLRNKPNHRLAALTSGGKDSNAALYRMKKRNSEISCLATIRSENTESYMFDVKKAESVVEEQAEKLGIPLLIRETEGEKEKELEDLEEALRQAKEEYGVEGVVSGAIASTYQRDRVEKVAEQLGLKTFAPLWMTDQESYMRWLVREGFEVEITGVAAKGLDESWVDRELEDDSVEKLIELSREHGFNAAGEGGEYETKVIGFPAGLET